MDWRGFNVTIAVALAAVALSPAPGQAQLARRSSTQAGRPGFSLGATAGLGVANVLRVDERLAHGLMFGGRFRWQGGTSGASLALDVQPFRGSAAGVGSPYRALFVVPAYEVSFNNSRVQLGVGAAVYRFEEEAPLGGRTEVAALTGISGSVGIWHDVRLELTWRRTSQVRGYRTHLWSLMLTRLWGL